MDPSVVRAWRFERQFPQPKKKLSPAQWLERTGWVRSVGGVSPYLALFARGRIARAAVDKAIADLALHELPAVRGCTYVVPAADFALALRAGQGFSSAAQIASAKKYLAVTDAEIARLCMRVVDALAKAPLDPADLKNALGDAVRHLGDAGKKRGLTTTLPLALLHLQSTGDIRRVPTNGRLDQQRYLYARWPVNPLAARAWRDDELGVELARKFFDWTGPAPIDDFVTWSGLGVRAARAAVDALGLEPLSGTDSLCTREVRDELAAFEPARAVRCVAVGSLDNILHLRRSIPELLDARDRTLKIHGEKAMTAIGGLGDLPHHAILANGRLIGLWDYDLDRGSIAYALFPGVKVDVSETMAEAERFVRDELGDARTFSLDSPESRAPRVTSLRKPKWK